MQGHAQGFTIIEVTIFLAISGLLLVGMFLGTGTMAARQRFKDTTDNAQTFFQTQYEEVVNGVNVRAVGTSCGAVSTTPGQSPCLLLGKLLTISANSSTIQTNYIISTQQLTGSESDSQAKLIGASLQIVPDGQTTYEIKWGATVSEATRSTPLPLQAGRGGVNSIAFVQLPDSGRIVQLYYKNSDGYSTSNLTSALTKAVATDVDAYSPPANATGPGSAVCIKNDSDFGVLHNRSAVTFGQGQGAGNITTNYDPGTLCPL